MRKLSVGITSVIAFASTAATAFAQGDEVLNASVKNAQGTIAANTSIGAIVTFAVAFIIIIAALAALLYIVIGAFQWITSGGDKQKVADARNHIIAAVIGLIVIALSFVIINVVISALGLGSLTNLRIQTLNQIQKGQ